MKTLIISLFLATMTVAQAASIVGMTPNSGSGTSHTFYVQGNDPAGASDIQYIITSFGTWAGANSCTWLAYPSSNTFYLLSDDGSSWGSPYTLGDGTTLNVHNSQCLISLMYKNVSGNDLAITWTVTFSASFTGLKTVQSDIVTNNNTVAGPYSVGSWTPSTDGSPLSVAVVTTTTDNGASGTFSVTGHDPNGYGDIQYSLFSIGTWAGANSCPVLLYSNGVAYLLNDAGTSFGGGGSMGSATVLSNSQCSLALSGASKTSSGNNTTWNFPLTFSSSFSGTRPMQADIVTANNTVSGPVNLGNWTIPIMQTTGSFGASRDERVIPSSLMTIDTLNGQTVYVPSSDHPLTSINITGPTGDDPAVMKFHDMFSVVLRDAKPNAQVWARLISYYPDVADQNGITTISYSQPNIQGNILCGVYIPDNQTPEYSGGWLLGTTDSTGYFTMSAQVPALGGGQTVSFYVGTDSGTVANGCPAYSTALNQINYVASVSYWATDANNNPTPPVFQ